MVMDPGMKSMLENQFKDLPEEFKKDLPLDQPFYTVTPSKEFPTGMKGRLPVFEVLTVDLEIQAAIVARKSEEDMWKIARKKGMTTLREDAMIKCLNKKIPFAEIATL
jgi:type II secretory ATPase GspE/PulE/Tfp pilus assembly ATPase PilB-like protein